MRNVIVKSVKRHPIDRLVDEEGFQVYKSHEEKNIAIVTNEEKEYACDWCINFTVTGTIDDVEFVIRLANNIGPFIPHGEPKFEIWRMEGPQIDWSDDEYSDLIECATSDWNFQKIMGEYE